MSCALVIMAAGMGSRFGGSKQTTPVDAEGDRLIDFSMYDARKAGFDELVFVIKEEMYESFREDVGRNAERFFRVSYVFQKAELPEEAAALVKDGAARAALETRTKPWGTGQAVLCAAEAVKVPFCVINADDFYGRDAFREMYRFLSGPRAAGEYAMCGYELEKTVTENGSVSRGECETDADGFLTRITERVKIVRREGGEIAYTEDGETFVPLAPDTTVSMNFWGFGPEFFEVLRTGFARFLEEEAPLDPLKKEYYLPTAAAQAMEAGARVRVLKTDADWYGITYREDLDRVKEEIAALKEAAVYPKDLWA